MTKKACSDQRRSRRAPEKLQKDTLDINDAFEALPEAVWGVDYHKIGQILVNRSLDSATECYSMCVMCVPSPKPLPCWGSLFHGFPDQSQNKVKISFYTKMLFFVLKGVYLVMEIKIFTVENIPFEIFSKFTLFIFHTISKDINGLCFD